MCCQFTREIVAYIVVVGVDGSNALIVRKIDRLRTNVMNKLRVVNAFKAAGAAATKN